MLNYIKADLYYFLHNRIIVLISTIISLYIPYKIIFKSYYSVSSSDLCLSIYMLNFDWLLIIVADIIILGIISNNIFKKNLFIHQIITSKCLLRPASAIIIAEIIASVMMILPTLVMFIIIAVFKGAWNGYIENMFDDVGPHSIVYLSFLMLVGIIGLVGIAVDCAAFSILFYSEKKGIVTSVLYETIKYFLICILTNVPDVIIRKCLGFSSYFDLALVSEMVFKEDDAFMSSFDIFIVPVISLLIRLMIVFGLLKLKDKNDYVSRKSSV